MMTFEVGKVLDSRYWQAPVYCFEDVAGQKNEDMEEKKSGIAFESYVGGTYHESLMRSLAKMNLAATL